MLEANHGGQGVERPTPFRAFALEELGALVDRLAAPPLSSLYEGAQGDHGWISVIDRGFVLHAYFGEEVHDSRVVGFELYGPRPPGTERIGGDPYDGSGLAGLMTTECLKGVLALLDQGRSPVEYVRGTALSASVVKDE